MTQCQVQGTLVRNDFNNQTYFTNDPNQKKFIAGTLHSYEYVSQGVKQKVLGIQFYPQDAGAHVNLKSKERKTPNLVLKDPNVISRLRSLNGQPVKLAVNDESYVIDERVTVEEVSKFHEEIIFKKNKKKLKIANGSDVDVALFDSMANDFSASELAGKAESYGGKASRLALRFSQ